MVTIGGGTINGQGQVGQSLALIFFLLFSFSSIFSLLFFFILFHLVLLFSIYNIQLWWTMHEKNLLNHTRGRLIELMYADGIFINRILFFFLFLSLPLSLVLFLLYL